MVILCDTSVLVPSLVEKHSHHESTLRLMNKILPKLPSKLLLSSHSLAEFHATITWPKGHPPLTPELSVKLIEEYVITNYTLIELNIEDYRSAIQRASEKKLKDGMIYDAIIFQAALKGKADILLTWNQKDFHKLNNGEMKIFTPLEFYPLVETTV